MTDVGRVVVSRPRAIWRDRFRAYTLFIDGVRCAKIRSGEEISLMLPTGTHTAQARIDWVGSPQVVLDVRPDNAVRLVVKPAGNSLMFWQLFMPTGYLHLSVDLSDEADPFTLAADTPMP